MGKLTLETIYNNMVCSAPKGAELTIEYMPECFEHDATDNDSPHVHTFYEIIWFTEGGGTHTVDFKEYRVERNSLFFLSPGQVHFFDHAKGHKGILLRFCTDFLKEETAKYDMFLKYSLFNAFDALPYCTVSDETARTLYALIGNIQEEQGNGGMVGHVEMIRSLARIFLIVIHRYCEKTADSHSLSELKATHRLFVAFRKMVEQHYSDMRSVAEYADKLNVSPKTLHNCVMECSGKTPFTYINDRIMLEARRLLRFSGMMVKEIAGYLGFEDPSYFVKFFKRQTGYLPSAYREMEEGR